MKAATAARKLGIFLPAAPPDFQSRDISRGELAELQSDPPDWLARLRAEGPHPRSVVAAKLGISSSGLARAGLRDPLSTAQIRELLAAPPQWLLSERAIHAKVRAEKARAHTRAATEEG